MRLNQYVDRRVREEGDWLCLSSVERWDKAAGEILDGFDTMEDALDASETFAGREIATVTAMGHWVDSRLLVDAVEWVSRRWLQDDQNDCLRARGDSRWHKMCSVHNRASGVGRA